MVGLIGLTLEKIYLLWDVSNLPVFQIIYLLVVIAMGGGIIYLNEVVAMKKLKQKLELFSLLIYFTAF